mmetsp:Transcript_33556/g.65972  ORF Transcript_33556/g.65972 Transcript_33556/m.65972 type:complete len:310 (-) Transcript_33556:1334-2263(-)
MVAAQSFLHNSAMFTRPQQQAVARFSVLAQVGAKLELLRNLEETVHHKSDVIWFQEPFVLSTRRVGPGVFLSLGCPLLGIWLFGTIADAHVVPFAVSHDLKHTWFTLNVAEGHPGCRRDDLDCFDSVFGVSGCSSFPNQVLDVCAAEGVLCEHSQRVLHVDLVFVRELHFLLAQILELFFFLLHLVLHPSNTTAGGVGQDTAPRHFLSSRSLRIASQHANSLTDAVKQRRVDLSAFASGQNLYLLAGPGYITDLLLHAVPTLARRQLEQEGCHHRRVQELAAPLSLQRSTAHLVHLHSFVRLDSECEVV